MDFWECFNFDLIMREASMRYADALKSTAIVITPEKRTLNYWVAHVAHANVIACFADPSVIERAHSDAKITQQNIEIEKNV